MILHFKPITEENAEEIHSYYKNCTYKISEYSVGIKLMWAYLLESEYTVYADCLLVAGKNRGRQVYDFPVPIDDKADVNAALDAITSHCMELGIPLEFNAVPLDKLPILTAKYKNMEIRRNRNISDYLYLASDFREFAGKKYAGQRNHVRKFHKLYPTAEFREFTEKDMDLILEFKNQYDKEFDNHTYGAKTELEHATKMLRFVGSPYFVSGGFVLDGKIISFCMSEICGNTMVDHIEKAFARYEGIFPAMVQEFAKMFATKVDYINREDDAGIRGMRTSKTQYGPCDVLDKNQVRVHTELYFIEKIPTVHTDRLVLDAITEEDIPVYNKLCLDDERNRYWGYDYREDEKNPDEEYFFHVQKKDFGSSMSMNFAVRLGDRMIGEVILYHFDWQGGCEIGIRILEEYEGCGYATEAFEAAAEYALYQIGMDTVYAKCMKPNLKSRAMLSKVLRSNGEDDTYYYFKKNV